MTSENHTATSIPSVPSIPTIASASSQPLSPSRARNVMQDGIYLYQPPLPAPQFGQTSYTPHDPVPVPFFGPLPQFPTPSMFGMPSSRSVPTPSIPPPFAHPLAPPSQPQHPAPATTRGKRKNPKPPATTKEPAKKRQRRVPPAGAPDISTFVPAEVCGAGPSSSNPVSQSTTGEIHERTAAHATATPEILPQPATNSIPEKRSRGNYKGSATDVWFFARGLDTAEPPSVWPTNEPILTSKPRTKWVGCKLCTAEWKVWICESHGVTKNFRTHLREKH
ncbi:hypothetical protein BXZ70DRAFT_1076246, partial [Cristinia sonorae]